MRAGAPESTWNTENEKQHHNHFLAFGAFILSGVARRPVPNGLKCAMSLNPPNYPLIYPKYLLLRAIRAPLKGHWGVLEWEVPAKIQSQVSCYSVGHVPSKDTVETQSEP